MAESNVRKVVAPDMAFARWRSETIDRSTTYCCDECDCECDTEDRDLEVFRAGYEAALRDQAEARKS